MEEEKEKTRWLTLASNFIEERGKGGEVKGESSAYQHLERLRLDEGDDWVEVGSTDLEGGSEVVDTSKEKLKRREGELYYDRVSRSFSLRSRRTSQSLMFCSPSFRSEELRRAGGDPFNDKSWWNKPWHDSYDYMQAHLPIRSQKAVLGHSVRVVCESLLSPTSASSVDPD